jgi:uncharacterized FlaG/YvyC family protein
MATEITRQLYPTTPSVTTFTHHSVEPSRPAKEENTEEKPNLSLEEVKKMVSQLSDVTQTMNHSLRFEIDAQTKDIIVKVIDPLTDKVIKELPSVEMQKLHRSLREAFGHLINKLI